MATSLQVKFRRSFVLYSALLAWGVAHADDCVGVNSTFFISHWRGPAPVSIDVEVLKAEARAGTPGRASPSAVAYQAELLGSDSEPAGQVLRLTARSLPDPMLLAQDNFRIVVDRKVEYLVHDIALLDQRSRGCPIHSAMVNSCRVRAGSFISFESSCGRDLP